MRIIPFPTSMINSAQTVITAKVKKTEVNKFHDRKKFIVTDNSKRIIKEKDDSKPTITPLETSDNALYACANTCNSYYEEDPSHQ